MTIKREPFLFGADRSKKDQPMTWKSFNKLALRTVIAVIGLAWLALWGYGVIVGDIPPARVLIPLGLMSALAVPIIYVATLWVCHTALFIKAKLRGDLPKFDKGYGWLIFVCLASGALVLATFVVQELGGAQLPDAVDGLVAVVGSVTFIICGLAALIFFKDQYLRWFFISENQRKA